MSIKMNVHTEKALGTLIIEDATEANKTDVIKGFFNLMGSEGSGAGDNLFP